MKNIDHKIEEAAKALLGHTNLFKHQRQACEAILSKQNVLLVAPMGSGKSLCYQLPTLLSAKPTLVISPLIALMDDQAEKARLLGLTAEALHSGVDSMKQLWTISNWVAGNLNIMFTSPERLSSPHMIGCLKKRKPGLVVIDEAHCISTWGSRFRPVFRQLGAILKSFDDIPVLAMTASAKPVTQIDIIQTLRLGDPVSVTVPFELNNISLNATNVSSMTDRLECVLKIAQDERHLPMVIFCVTKKQCEFVGSYLSQRGHKVYTYHAGMSSSDRSLANTAFQDADRSILVATSAYEMGIDKSDIRTVVHLSLPTTLESYVQGIGRAGRDGRPASSQLFYSDHDLDLIDALSGRGSDHAESPLEQEIYSYAVTKRCRVSYLNEYFFPDSHLLAEKHCGNCDSCRSQPRQGNLRSNQGGMYSPIALTLKNWRRSLAIESGIKAFQILSDREIGRLSVIKPQSVLELGKIAGIRRSVLKVHGKAIIAVMRAKSDPKQSKRSVIRRTPERSV
jgi:ATP-dependent DNA helicase RecQ